jgi:hypothetical protein
MTTEGPSVLVSAALRHGSTAEIAAAICDELRQRGLRARVLVPAEVTALDSYDVVVLGSAVYVGHWLRSAMDRGLAGDFRDWPEVRQGPTASPASSPP